MSKKNRTQKKVAKLAAGVSKEQEEIEKTISKELETPKKVIAQTSEKAAKLNPVLKPKVDAAKDAAKGVKEEKKSKIDLTKKTDAPAAKSSTKEEKAKKDKEAGKYINNITSMEKLGDYCFAQGWDEKHPETIKAFVAGYKLKKVTDMKFITPRIAIYMNIARKRALKAKAEKAVVKKERAK